MSSLSAELTIVSGFACLSAPRASPGQPPHDRFAPKPHHDKTRDGDQNAERETLGHLDTSPQGAVQRRFRALADFFFTRSGSFLPPVSRFHSSKVLFEIFPCTR